MGIAEPFGARGGAGRRHLFTRQHALREQPTATLTPAQIRFRLEKSLGSFRHRHSVRNEDSAGVDHVCAEQQGILGSRVIKKKKKNSRG